MLCLLYKNVIYLASLGDSRAVLGTASNSLIAPMPYLGQFHYSQALDQVKKRRNSQNEQEIHSFQLTFDQKPDLPEELTRITECGGLVERLHNASGAEVGPYRVWEQGKKVPGLSISRTLGDSACRKIGIISDPICSNHTITDQDYFIVIASDGIWDVMDNIDVISFVESYRDRCKKKVRASVQGHLVNPNNSSIAQMLCEEARVRWFSVVKEEGVSIDDISCVILEFKKNSDFLNGLKSDTVKSEKKKNEEQGQVRHGEFGRDPRRGSLAMPSNNNPVLI